MREFCDDSAVSMILLADGWHTVSRRSFRCGSFTIKASDGQSSVELADAVWWEEGEDDLVVVPRSSVLALKRRAYGPREEVSKSEGEHPERT
jgi:hypothetical protein